MHPTHRIARRAVLIVTVAALVGTGGCSSGAKPPKSAAAQTDDTAPQASAAGVTDPGTPRAAIHAIPERTGFLRDYSRLVPSPRHAETLYEMTSSLSKYTEFMIDPVQILPPSSARGAMIDPAAAADLAAGLRAEIVDALTEPFVVVDHVDPRSAARTARIRAAVTEVARSGRDPKTGAVLIGGAAMEFEIVDATTGERLLAAVEADSPDQFERAQGADPYGDARIVFAHWAARLDLALRDARSGALPATR